MYTKDLSANVPLYGQEQCIWCGAASAQMIRNGYPNPADCLYFTQLYLWNTIQLHNSTDPADAAWATDPHGLRGCLQTLSPAGVHWSEFANTNRDTLLFAILYWMNRLNYPCAVLINNGGHWVVIVGFVTDVEPVAGSTPTLQTIQYYDPEPHNVGTDTIMTGAQWFSGPWNGAIIYSGTWYNKYVAIVEPPREKGEVRVKAVKKIAKKLLSPAQAVKYAKRWIVEMRLAEQDKYRMLGRKDVSALEPMLVHEEAPGRQIKKVEKLKTRPRIKDVPSYYIVPFGFKGEIGERKEQMSRVCVLVDAYTGQLNEVTAFGQPVRYLLKEEAIEIVSAAMQTKQKGIRDADVALMFQPSDITHVRTWPFWRVKIGQRTVFVDQLGKLYGKLLPSVPGD
jgi:hypothetical protein